MRMEKIIICGRTRSWRSASTVTELLMSISPAKEKSSWCQTQKSPCLILWVSAQLDRYVGYKAGNKNIVCSWVISIYLYTCLSQVKWKKSDVKFEDRFDKYLDPSFFQHRVSSLVQVCIRLYRTRWEWSSDLSHTVAGLSCCFTSLMRCHLGDSPLQLNDASLTCLYHLAWLA